MSPLSAYERASAWLSAMKVGAAPKRLAEGVADISLGRDVGVVVRVLPYGPDGEIRATVRDRLARSLGALQKTSTTTPYIAHYERGLTIPEEGALEREVSLALLRSPQSDLCSRHRDAAPETGRICLLRHGVCLTPVRGALEDGYGPLVDLAPAPQADDDSDDPDVFSERIRTTLAHAASEYAEVANRDEFLHWWLVLLDDECAARSETVDAEAVAELSRSADALRIWSRITVLNTFGPLLHEDVLGGEAESS